MGTVYHAAHAAPRPGSCAIRVVKDGERIGWVAAVRMDLLTQAEYPEIRRYRRDALSFGSKREAREFIERGALPPGLSFEYVWRKGRGA